MQQVGCTARELSAASGLSQAILSRYRSGSRTPALDSDQLRRLISGLLLLQSEKLHASGQDSSGTAGQAAREEMIARFEEALRNDPGSMELITHNLEQILTSMDVNIKKLSQYLSYDPSYISRIRGGQRRPSNPLSFAQGVCSYLLENCERTHLQNTISRMSQTPYETLSSEEKLSESLLNLLVRQHTLRSSLPEPESCTTCSTIHFLKALDQFDLDEYINALSFDGVEAPQISEDQPPVKTFVGVDEMKKAELDFFLLTLNSDSQEPILMCSDMEMSDMAIDTQFAKNWMFAIAATIRKGLTLNIIHTLDRPYNEMMIGLESWIPLYMTGQVSSYYLTGSRSRFYGHLHYSSGAAAMTGECVRGHHDNGRYYLSTRPEDIEFNHLYCSHLIQCAKPLMEVFTKDTADRYTAFLTASSGLSGTRCAYLSIPPLFSMPDDLLERILSRYVTESPQKENGSLRPNGITPEEANRIRAFAAFFRHHMQIILSRGPVENELTLVSREEFETHPVLLGLSGVFPTTDLQYTWEEYQEHIEATRIYAREHPGCILRCSNRPGLRNIQIAMLKGHWAMVSKIKGPSIHFVIRHPKLREAIEQMVLPLVENKPGIT